MRTSAVRAGEAAARCDVAVRGFAPDPRLFGVASP